MNLDDPALTIHVEALSSEAFYYFGKEPGPGGLPTGVSGRVVALLSGGIDSPVAAYRLMKRGCRVIPVHFHSYPILSRASQEKVRELAALLTRYQQYTRLYMVAFGEIQQHVMLAVQPALRVVMYRRLMMRIAEAIAHRAHAGALVDGRGDRPGGFPDARKSCHDRDRGHAAGLPSADWFRQGGNHGRGDRLGTYPISIIEDQDCCQLFTPKHPATRARREEIEAAERSLADRRFCASGESRALPWRTSTTR